ncbi:hypothetical protein [Actinomadura violacea]|uniref:Uncharacterized protein n=1 Tax=Actinomadura violacea TaxID=2819934 RepID=A0ABS3RQ42_9ACTN|nr:hypothetical protein [Actinomadura violacea]MBO2458184.1 hypothetical protein [Actinomadura violacea]
MDSTSTGTSGCEGPVSVGWGDVGRIASSAHPDALARVRANPPASPVRYSLGAALRQS